MKGVILMVALVLQTTLAPLLHTQCVVWDSTRQHKSLQSPSLPLSPSPCLGLGTEIRISTPCSLTHSHSNEHDTTDGGLATVYWPKYRSHGDCSNSFKKWKSFGRNNTVLSSTLTSPFQLVLSHPSQQRRFSV